MSIEQIPLPEGILRGESRDGYTVFKGVPYAAPPVGELRFAPPQPPRPWPGVYTADHFSAACPQLPEQPGSFYEKEFYSPPERQPRMDEDCLYLNIWTPAAAPEEQLPVALWIHGGAFDHGFGHEIEFDGAAFCRRGVVLVTVNYRVNVFGFLSHPWLEEGADNLGIRDQIAALSWVRTHIKAFGGNPDNITVFGQSAGAISTQTLVSSPLTGGMIHKAIFQSAGGYRNGLCAARSRQEAEAFGTALAEELGAHSLADLRAIPAMELMRRAMAFARASGNSLPFAPVWGSDVLPGPYDILTEQGRVAPIPYLLGATKNDIFSGDSNPIQAGCVSWSQLLDHLRGTPSYVYAFNRTLPGDNAGAFHSSELWYVFGTLHRCWRPFSHADRALSQSMCDAWAHFMKHGTPDAAGLWRPCTCADPYVRIFDVEGC